MRQTCRVLSALLLIGAGAVDAQTVQQAHAWVSYFGDNRVSATWSVYTEASLRRAEAGATWQQQLWAAGATRDLSRAWRLTAAVGGTNSIPYGELPSRSHAIEVRPWVQVQGVRRLGRATWTDRSRVEWRVTRPYGSGAPADPAWSQVYRLRRLDRVVLPLRPQGPWYVAGLQEWLTNLGPRRARATVFEQTRTQLLLGRDVRRGVRIEGGYMLQLLARRGGVREYNHTMLIVVRNSAPWRTP
jgi:hypothetical protein